MALGWETTGRRVRQSQVTAKRLSRQLQDWDPVYTHKNIRECTIHRIRKGKLIDNPHTCCCAEENGHGRSDIAQSVPDLEWADLTLDTSLTQSL
jgi:hypothetical protein